MELARFLQLKNIPVYSKRSIDLFTIPLARQVLLLLRYLAAEHAARRAGREAPAATYAANRAEVLVNQSKFDDAVPLLELAVDQLRSTRTTANLPFALLLLARAVAGTSGPAAARPLFEEALAVAEASGDSESLSEARSWLVPVS